METRWIWIFAERDGQPAATIDEVRGAAVAVWGPGPVGEAEAFDAATGGALVEFADALSEKLELSDVDESAVDSAGRVCRVVVDWPE